MEEDRQDEKGDDDDQHDPRTGGIIAVAVAVAVAIPAVIGAPGGMAGGVGREAPRGMGGAGAGRAAVGAAGVGRTGMRTGHGQTSDNVIQSLPLEGRAVQWTARFFCYLRSLSAEMASYTK